MLPLMLAGYLFLLVLRPYEYWSILGDLRIERVYMLIFMIVVLLHKDKRFLSNPLNGAVACFTLTLLLSGIFGISWTHSWPFIVDYLKYVIFYFMVILSVRDEEDFRVVLLAFLVVMFLYVGKSAWEFFVHDRYVFRMGIKRMMGIDITYGDPNAFAASICYSLPLAWALIKSRFRSAWVTVFLWIYGILSLAAVMFTGSRSGMVTFILFLLLIVLGSSRKIWGILLAGMVLVVSWDYMPEDLQKRFLSTFSGEYAAVGAQASADGRTQGFLRGLELYKSYPILGIGPHNFPLTWPGMAVGPNAHNVYGQLLSELGTAGLLSFGLLLWLLYRQNRNIIVRFQRLVPQKPAADRGSPPAPVARTARVNGSVGNVRNGPSPESQQRKISALDVESVPRFHSLVGQAIIQTMILLLFKGWADHNLYRYTWLLLAALTVLGTHFFNQELKRNGQP